MVESRPYLGSPTNKREMILESIVQLQPLEGWAEHTIARYHIIRKVFGNLTLPPSW